MIKQLTTKLSNKRSYLKWGAARIAERFNCSERTANIILRKLHSEKQEYLQTLKTKTNKVEAA